MKRFIVLAVLTLCAPAAHATPLACTDVCTITTGSYGYLAPATEIANGARVTWVTTELSHPTAEWPGGDPCFSVAVGALTAPVAVRFDAVDGQLYATTAPGAPGEQTLACAGAHALSNGGYTLTFGCMLHQWMRGALVVDPA